MSLLITDFNVFIFLLDSFILSDTIKYPLYSLSILKYIIVPDVCTFSNLIFFD